MLAEKLKNYINSTLLIITEREADFNYIKGLAEDYECIMIKDSEILIESLEIYSPGQLLTLIITSNVPKDIEEAMPLFVKTLEEMSELNVVECTDGETYFRDSFKINDLYDFEASEEERKNLNTNKEEDNYLIGVKEKVEIKEEIKEEAKEEVKEENKKIDMEKNNNNNEANRINELNGLITSLDKELKENLKKLEKALSFSDKLEKEKDNLLTEINLKEREINNLKLQGNKDNEESTDLLEELKSREVLIVNLENDIKELKVKGVELEIDSTSKRELIKDKNKEIRELKNEIEELADNINNLTSSMDSMEENYVTVDKLESLKKILNEKDIEIASLNDQVRVLKIDIRKTLDEHSFLQEEFENLQASYKTLVANGGNGASNTEFKDIYLSDEVKTSIFYFKIFNQPPYFKSFVESLNRLISTNGKTMLIIIRELDDISRKYYSQINEYSNLDEVNEAVGENMIILKPSKLMLTENEEFYKNYKNIIVLDYSRTNKVLIKGSNVFSIYTVINEKEKDLLGLVGMTLTVGETSVVDLKYDVDFKYAKTAYVKKLAVDKKVKNWLSNLGIKV